MLISGDNAYRRSREVYDADDYQQEIKIILLDRRLRNLFSSTFLSIDTVKECVYCVFFLKMSKRSH